jgi:glucose/arabinose dehydrogenase
MRSTYLYSFILFLGYSGGAQPGTARLTPQVSARLMPAALDVHPKFNGKNLKDKTLQVPEGYKAQVFYRGRLSKPRFMAWSHDSVLHVACMNNGEIIAIPDKNHDGVADTAIVAARDVKGHDVKFFRKDMYVVGELKVWKLRDTDGDGEYESRTVFIDSIQPGKQRPPGGHTTRTIVFDEKNKKVYLSVGSQHNVARETDRAVIYEYDLNGKNKRVFADGTRNSIGMAIHPKTGELWANNNGSDHQGNDIPPEWIAVVRKGGFYGYPFAYGNQVYFDFKKHPDYERLLPIIRADSLKVKRMVQPEALVQAHSAPMAIEFSNRSFSEPYRNGCFVAYRGSWDRHPATGYKVVYLHFNNKNKVTGVSDFITGFDSDGEKENVWARPVGLETDLRGNLYMGSDDINEFIIILKRK